MTSIIFRVAVCMLACTAQLHAQQRTVDLRAADGTLLKATYHGAARPGPGVIMLHMCDNSDRRAWNDLGAMLNARGISAIAMDYRGHGESGGVRDADLTREERRRISLELWPGDLDAAFNYLVSQPGVVKDRIAIVGGSCGAGFGMVMAQRHPEIKTMVLLAGGQMIAAEFLPTVPWMPILAVASHDDDGAVAMMKRILSHSTNAHNRLKEYATGGHGTDLFRTHKDLEPMIADWLVEHLITRSDRR